MPWDELTLVYISQYDDATIVWTREKVDIKGKETYLVLGLDTVAAFLRRWSTKSSRPINWVFIF